MVSKINNLTLSRPSFTERIKSSPKPKESKRKSDLISLISVGEIQEHDFELQQDFGLEQIDEEEKGNLEFMNFSQASA
jgi:hypothetical protein